MKKYLLAAAIGAAATPALAVCPYPLDATDAQIVQSGYTPFDSVNLQSAEYVAAPTTSIVNLIALSDTGFAAGVESAQTGLPGGDVTLPAAGIVAYEIAIDNFPSTTSTEANLYLGGGFLTSNGVLPTVDASQDSISFNFIFANSASGSLSGVIAANRTGGVLTWAQGNVGPLALPLPANTRVGIYLNMGTRQVGYTVNGTDYGYLQNELGGAFLIPAGVQEINLALNGIMQMQVGSSLAGAVVGATLVTDQSQFTQPFPAGTTDICLTSTGTGGLKLPNGKPYPGKANPPGLQKFQSLPLPLKPLGQALKP